MYMIGDIGNTETKICLMKHNQQIVKKIILKQTLFHLDTLKKILKDFQNINQQLKELYLVA